MGRRAALLRTVARACAPAWDDFTTVRTRGAARTYPAEGPALFTGRRRCTARAAPCDPIVFEKLLLPLLPLLPRLLPVLSRLLLRAASFAARPKFLAARTAVITVWWAGPRRTAATAPAAAAAWSSSGTPASTRFVAVSATARAALAARSAAVTAAVMAPWTRWSGCGTSVAVMAPWTSWRSARCSEPESAPKTVNLLNQYGYVRREPKFYARLRNSTRCLVLTGFVRGWLPGLARGWRFPSPVF